MAALLSTEGKVGAASISSWENMRTPASPPQSRLDPYTRLVVTSRRSDQKGQLIKLAELTESEKENYDKLLGELEHLWDSARGSQDQEAAAAATYRSWFFDDDGPV